MKTITLVLVLAGLLFLCLARRASFSGASTLLDPASFAQAQDAVERQPQDFAIRCHSAGVVVCQGFDSPLINIAARWPAAGLYPGGDNMIHGKFDREQKASGEGSLRFEILSHTGQNAAGYWRQPLNRNFGPGSTFYVQFQERFSPEMLKNDWGDTTWKQAIFHNEKSTCGEVELTTVQYYHSGIPFMYTACGGRSIVTNNGNPPYKLQQGDYNCSYGFINKKDCFYYPANKWVTFFYQISIGRWGQPDSSINAWVTVDGHPYRQWIKMSNFVLKNDNPGHDYDCVTLLTYMTNKDTGKDLPTAYAWYDELIVSTQPIAPPAAAAASNPETPNETKP